MERLPIDDQIPQITETLLRQNKLILEAPPGAGKTTRVPPALLAKFPGEILVLEPRRLAARLAARRIASELGEAVGRTVGYQVRFEDVSSSSTRLRFLTEGVLTRRIMRDRELAGVSAVLLDEFHERHLEGDLALAMLLHLQRASRPDLRLVIMSATLDTSELTAHLGGAPVIRTEGRLYPLDVRYAAPSGAPQEVQVAEAVRQIAAEGMDGDMLVFLPGAAEIRRAQRECARLQARFGFETLPLYGDLSPEEQDRAVTPGPTRKVILSTNIAESSVTLEGVSVVIDSGLVRVAEHSPWSGLPGLAVRKINQASAAQRAGRAGRTGPGRVVRLYPEAELRRQPVNERPEIERADLSGAGLQIRASGFGGWQDLPWLTNPPEPHREAADALLHRLGAIDSRGRLTPTGRKVSALPLSPRLARLVVEAVDRGVGEEGKAVAAALSAGDRLEGDSHATGPSDLLALADAGLSPRAGKIFRQLGGRAHRKTQHASDEAILLSILSGFPDRVARRSGQQYLLSGGGSGILARNSVVRDAEFLIAVEAETRPDFQAGGGQALIRLASKVEPEWLIDLFPDRVEDRSGLQWNRQAERAEAISSLVYDGLVLLESWDGAADPEQIAGLLAEKAWEAGLERFVDPEELDQFLCRAAFCVEHFGTPKVGEAELQAALRSLCTGLRSFADLRRAAGNGAFLQMLMSMLAPGDAVLLEREAPTRIQLPSGRRAPVRYVRDKDPWVASRLQDFFGMEESPKIAGGRTALVIHLLAPNQRPVQTTTDLAGFWRRLYPEIRKQLSRRYPRHAWPENPVAPRTAG